MCNPFLPIFYFIPPENIIKLLGFQGFQDITWEDREAKRDREFFHPTNASRLHICPTSNVSNIISVFRLFYIIAFDVRCM